MHKGWKFSEKGILFFPSILLETVKLYEKNNTALVVKNFGKTSMKEMQV